MKISEHANYLLNEYGRLQFDYAAYCKPYGESLRNEARNNLEEYIAELEGKFDQFTAHSNIAWQDDKSSNDTQTQTFVYGKDDEE